MIKGMHFLKEEIDELKVKGLHRALKTVEEVNGVRYKVKGKTLINFCSNNYLGLAFHPKVIKAAIKALKKFGAGSPSSRLVSGNMELHEKLEDTIADYEGTESAIVFPTGYMANLGAIQALVGSEDAVIIDRLNHASIIDGAKLSGAKLIVYSHRDMGSLESALKKASNFRRRLVVTDHVFSMDGDIAPVKKLLQLTRIYDSMLMLDVAHSIDRPVIEPDELKSVIIMGTLSKAIGSLGGYIAGNHELIDYLKNRGRAFIYTTALPPSVAAASIAAYEVIAKDGLIKKNLWENVSYLKNKLKPLGFDTLDSVTQIIPLVIGDASKAKEMSDELFEKGIFLSAIRPPTVPKGTSRLRLTVTSMHTKADIDELIKKLEEVKGKYLG